MRSRSDLIVCNASEIELTLTWRKGTSTTPNADLYDLTRLENVRGVRMTTREHLQYRQVQAASPDACPDGCVILMTTITMPTSSVAVLAPHLFVHRRSSNRSLRKSYLQRFYKMSYDLTPASPTRTLEMDDATGCIQSSQEDDGLEEKLGKDGHGEVILKAHHTRDRAPTGTSVGCTFFSLIFANSDY